MDLLWNDILPASTSSHTGVIVSHVLVNPSKFLWHGYSIPTFSSGSRIGAGGLQQKFTPNLPTLQICYNFFIFFHFLFSLFLLFFFFLFYYQINYTIQHTLQKQTSFLLFPFFSFLVFVFSFFLSFLFKTYLFLKETIQCSIHYNSKLLFLFFSFFSFLVFTFFSFFFLNIIIY